MQEELGFGNIVQGTEVPEQRPWHLDKWCCVCGAFGTFVNWGFLCGFGVISVLSTCP